MRTRLALVALWAAALIAGQAEAANRKPLVIGPTGQQQQLQSADTLTDGGANVYPTVSGTPGSGNCAKFVSANQVGDAGAACGSGGGSGALQFISQTITSGAATSVTFSSVSGAYRDLVVVVDGSSTHAVTNDSLAVQLNGDSGADYFFQYMRSVSSGVSAAASSQTYFAGYGLSGSSYAPNPSHFEVTIGNYANSTIPKSMMLAGGNFSALTSVSGVWTGTAAVTSVTVFIDSGSAFTNGTVVSLYGRGS